MLRRLFLLHQLKSRAVFLLHLFTRNHSATEVGEAHQLELDCLQAFISL